MDSVSQASPKNPIWKKMLSVLGDPLVSPRDQSREIWRAAACDPDAALLDKLSNPLIFEACRLATGEGYLSEVLSTYEGLIISSQASGLFLDIAKRALAHAILCKGGSGRFTQELFSEVISYYASRDLSGVVGNQDRVPTVFDIIRLKEAFRDLARGTVGDCGTPPTQSADWKKYVRRVLLALKS